MTINEFLKYQLEDSGHQLQAVFADFPEGQWDAKITDEAMSAAETAFHLCECYTAFLAHADGKEHSWGTYDLDDKSPANLVGTMFSLRARSIEALEKSQSEQTAKDATAYIILHDAYHVGQMCTLRLKLGNFDAYSIYQHN